MKKRGRLSSMGTESHTRQNFVPESVNCPGKCIFYNFVQASAKNLSLLNQCTYMHLKVLITHFQKMVWFIGI